jgi:hypothetical protein
MALQIKRGTNVQRLTLLLAAGEPYFVTDYAGLGVAPMWMGTGSVYGGIPASGGELQDLSDVIYSGLANNDLLKYDSTLDQWVNTTSINLAGTATVGGSATVGGTLTVTGGATTGNLTAGAAFGSNTHILTGTTTLAGDVSVGGALLSRKSFESQKTGTTATSVNSIVSNSYYSYYIAYSGITTTGGACVVTLPTTGNILGQAVGFIVQVSSVGTMTGITANTTYYAYDITATSFKIASTRQNAINSVALATTGSTGSGIAFFGIPIGFGDSHERYVSGLVPDAGATKYLLMKDEAVVIAGTTAYPYGTTRYNIRLMNNGVLASTPNLTLDSDGYLTVAGLIASGAQIGNAVITDTTESTSTATGALKVAGGVGITKSLYVGGRGQISGDLRIDDTTQSTSTLSGSIQTDGGVGIVKDLYVGGVTRFLNTTDSTTVDTGSVQIDGGLGVNKNVFIGGYFRVQNQAVIDNDLTVGGNLIVNGTTTTINSTTLAVDDKNIELGSVANATDVTADGGGIILKGTTDKSITWSSSTGRWQSEPGFNAPGSLIGNVSIADGANDNTITTTTGNLILDSATNLVQVDGGLTVNGVEIGADSANSIGTVTGPLQIYAAATEVINFNENNAVSILGTVQFGPTNNSNYGMYFFSRAETDFTFDNNSTNVMRGTRGVVGVNDSWFVGGDSSTTDGGTLILASGDNGNEPIVARQYTGAITDANSSYRELVLLDASGNTTIPSNLQVTGNNIKSSTGSNALTFNDTNVKVNGELTITGNTIRSSGGSAFPSGTVALTLSGADVAAQGNLFVENNGNLYVSGQSLVLNNNDTAGGNVELVAYRGTGGADSRSIRWDETTDRWQTTTNGSTFLNIPNQNLDTTSDVSFGNVSIDGISTINTQTTTNYSSLTPVSISDTTRASQKAIIRIKDNVSGEIHVLEALAFYKGTTAYLTTYAEMYSSAALATFTASISAGTLSILATPASTNSTTFTVVRTSLD